MDRLWAPWRIEYIRMEKYQGCFLCDYPKEKKDRENLILWRGKHVFIIMNRFPYNNGHVMISPYRHVSDYEQLTDDEILEIHYAMKLILKALKNTMNPDGFNIGLNLGRVAGASIYEHIHFHIVPRWLGDTNFMPVIAETKIISEGIFKTYDILKKEIEKIISRDEY